MRRAGYVDDELIVYNSITLSQKSSQPGASGHNLALLAKPLCLAGN